jgi:hypothetical protein
MSMRIRAGAPSYGEAAGCDDGGVDANDASTSMRAAPTAADGYQFLLT